ncbi:hypothetical protein BCF74_11819 [Knoellia remsis]|uniref:Uncharacterized protein n=1 Tax=Knoellia remsis TaxID=407159 RepID=A0A2T0UFA7_9MICO|nr:hypothetical protein BCF74_11819 [Knoellia remsis]
MRNERVRSKLYEVVFVEGVHQCLERVIKQRKQRVVRDVSSGDDQQLRGASRQKVTVPEVTILGDDDPLFVIRELGDLLIGRTVAIG